MRKVKRPVITKGTYQDRCRIYTLNDGTRVEVTHEGDHISIRNTDGPLVVAPVVSNVVNVRAESRGN